MEFDVTARTYCISGGHPTVSLVSDFLLGDQRDFGPAVSELEITFHFPHRGPPRKTLEQLYTVFHAYRLSLPKVVFRRKRGQVAIDIASELLDGRDWDRDRDLSVSLFNAAVAETIEALSLLKKRLAAKDDFNLDAFLNHCNEARSRLPASAEELAGIADQCEKRRAARRAAMSPWESLGIDWQDFHPEAREVLDDPMFWDCCNEFAPHGNDTGADLLEDYRKWQRRNPSGDPIMFYKKLIRQWGFPEDPSNDLDRLVMDEAAVALAFAELKLRADCRSEVADLARAALQRQRQAAIDAVEWPHRNERLKILDMLETRLSAKD